MEGVPVKLEPFFPSLRNINIYLKEKTLKIYWVNEYHYDDDEYPEGDLSSTVFYATRELAQLAADIVIERQHQRWEAKVAADDIKRDLREKALAVLKANDLMIDLPKVYGPPEFKHTIAVEEITVVTVVTTD